MVKRWIFYLASVLGCVIFWSAHQSWLSRLMMMTLVWLPWFSLGISLLPMLLAAPSLPCPTKLKIGDVEYAEIKFRSKLPLPPYRCRLELSRTLLGKTEEIKPNALLPTAHCGELLIRCKKLVVYDFLGLFRLPLKKLQPKSILVYPNKVPMEHPMELERFLAHSWQPKPGGGFAENHELRLFRPGDGLNQVHWKLTAKTGNLTIRQPMIPRHGNILLTVDISGTPDELDRKLGRLLWIGQYFLDKELQYEIQARAKEGFVTLPVTCETDLILALEQLMRCSPADDSSAWGSQQAASWHYHIGGEHHEA